GFLSGGPVKKAEIVPDLGDLPFGEDSPLMDDLNAVSELDGTIANLSSFQEMGGSGDFDTDEGFLEQGDQAEARFLLVPMDQQLVAQLGGAFLAGVGLREIRITDHGHGGPRGEVQCAAESRGMGGLVLE